MQFPRLPRFQRAPNVARIELTDRDREILRQVHRHRFLRSSNVVDLIGGSRQHILRRLQLLYHHGYLERPRAQIDYYHRGGSRSIAYGLGNKAAALLKNEHSLPFHRLDWGAKNQNAGRVFLEHALLISDIMIALELACRRNGRIRLLTADELPVPESTRRHGEPFHWNVRLPTGQKVGIIPDRVFGLEYSAGNDAGTEKSTRAYFFLEADRGTMPIQRQNPSQSSFHRKLLAYEATWTQNLHRTRLGLHRFRVLTVVTSPDRVKTLVAACRQLERGQGLFLFSDVGAFRAHADPLTMPWYSVSENTPEALLDSLIPANPLPPA